MTIENAIKIHDNLVAVAGPCINKHLFKSPLIDEKGNVYIAHITFVKTLVYNDDIIDLGIYGSYDIESLKGLILKTA